MEPYIEIWRGRERHVHQLDGEPLTVGRAARNRIVVGQDRSVSRLHALLVQVASSYSVRDLSSRNGKYINGERIIGERVLRPGDELRIGTVRIFYRAADVAGETVDTVVVEPPPTLTRREREILSTLCRPIALGDMFTEAVSVAEVARQLSVTSGAVKQHLLNLYAKFDVPPGSDKRRARLANEAIRRGAVVLADLLHPEATDNLRGSPVTRTPAS